MEKEKKKLYKLEAACGIQAFNNTLFHTKYATDLTLLTYFQRESVTAPPKNFQKKYTPLNNYILSNKFTDFDFQKTFAVRHYPKVFR